MSPKTRGRSTIINDTTSNAPIISTIISPTLTALQQQYVPSLLKIESVVPTRLTSHNNHRNIHLRKTNRLIHRSYSTLCNSTTVSYKNVSKIVNTNLHRHKNHHQPQENNGCIEIVNKHLKAKSAQANSTIIFENGVCKVQRTLKEGDAQSDRINLDRRGKQKKIIKARFKKKPRIPSEII